ncbi:MAG: glycosyltransferase [Deltaproteobacteria bacterium]|nr:glycosyltransferase [Deltaproteobacteria bacterium]
MDKPKVSVCIPTYNYARFLPQAIDSVLNQSFTDFELIIIDDCSVDDTKELVARYAAEDKRIIFEVNPVNVGMVQNWNRCLRKARGEYIKYLFGDDLFCSKDALMQMVDVLDADHSISLVASARNVIDPGSEILKVLSHFKDKEVIDGAEVTKACIYSQQNLVGEPSAVMFRKKHAGRCFDTRYKQLVDLEMWFHLLEQGNFAYINEPLSSFRVHPDQRSNVNARILAHIDDTIYLMSDYVCNPEKKNIDIGKFEGHYMMYDYRYQIWKEYKKGRIARGAAVQKMSVNYSLPAFYALYPFYKLYKPCRKLKRYLSRPELDKPVRSFGAERLARLSRMERWHFWFAGRQALVRRLLNRHMEGKDRLILDIGCGTGLMLEILEGMGMGRVVGMDVRPEGLRRTRQALPGSWLVQGEATRLPLADNAFDAVLMLDVMEHVDDRLLLSEVRRLLRPGGVALITAPAMPWMWSRRDEAAGHLRRYTRRGLVDAVENASLHVQEIGYYQFFLFPLVVAARLLDRSGVVRHDIEERPPAFMNAVFSRINSLEARWGDFIPWPWGSSLLAVCRKGDE